MRTSVRVERCIRLVTNTDKNGNVNQYYSVAGYKPLNGQKVKTQYFPNIEDARQYLKLIDNQRKINKFEAIDINNNGPQFTYPENIFHMIGIHPSEYPDTYDNIVDSFDSIFNNEINNLTNKERDIIIKHCKEYMTLKEIANSYGVTQERIRQIEAKGLRKLKVPYNFSKIVKAKPQLEILDADESKRIRDEIKEELKKEMTIDMAFDILCETYKLNREATVALFENKKRFVENGKGEVVDILDQPIESLNLNVRTHNCLKRARITTIRELVSKSEEDLFFKVRNLGRKTLRDIIYTLKEYDLHLKNPREEIENNKKIAEIVNKIYK